MEASQLHGPGQGVGFLEYLWQKAHQQQANAPPPPACKTAAQLECPKALLEAYSHALHVFGGKAEKYDKATGVGEAAQRGEDGGEGDNEGEGGGEGGNCRAYGGQLQCPPGGGEGEECEEAEA